MRAEKAFTFIEVIIVVAITLVVVMTAMAAYMKFENKQKVVEEGSRIAQVLLDLQKRSVQADLTPCAPGEPLDGYGLSWTAASLPGSIAFIAKCAGNSYNLAPLFVLRNGVTIHSYSSVGGEGIFTWPNGRVDSNFKIDIEKNNQHVCVSVDQDKIIANQVSCGI